MKRRGRRKRKRKEADARQQQANQTTGKPTKITEYNFYIIYSLTFFHSFFFLFLKKLLTCQPDRAGIIVGAWGSAGNVDQAGV